MPHSSVSFHFCSENPAICSTMVIKTIFALVFVLNASLAYANCPNIVTRGQWGARPPKSVSYMPTPVPYVIIHHTVTPECYNRAQCAARMRSMQDHHMDTNQWHDLGYSFVIGGDGDVYEVNGWNRVGAHTAGWNNQAIGIAFIGNYQNVPASPRMLDAAHRLIRCGVSLGMLRHNVMVLGAKQVRPTNSPGERLYQQIQSWPEWSHSP